MLGAAAAGLPRGAAGGRHLAGPMWASPRVPVWRWTAHGCTTASPMTERRPLAVPAGCSRLAHWRPGGALQQGPQASSRVSPRRGIPSTWKVGLRNHHSIAIPWPRYRKGCVFPVSFVDLTYGHFTLPTVCPPTNPAAQPSGTWSNDATTPPQCFGRRWHTPVSINSHITVHGATIWVDLATSELADVLTVRHDRGTRRLDRQQ